MTDIYAQPRSPRGASGRADDVTIAREARFRRLRKLVGLLRHPAWRSVLLRTGVAAAIEHRDVPFGPTFATILDVGAHHGQFALLARDRYPEAQIVCIEPLPDTVVRLRRVMRGDPQVTIATTAVAGQAGERDLHVSQMTDSSSLLPIRQPHVDAFPGTEEARTVSVSVTTLDALLGDDVQRPCLLKIDAQGGELDVLIGAESVLKEVDVAYVECSFVEFYEGQALADEVIVRFMEQGLRLDGAYSVVRDTNERCLQADLLFRRRG